MDSRWHIRCLVLITQVLGVVGGVLGMQKDAPPKQKHIPWMILIDQSGEEKSNDSNIRAVTLTLKDAIIYLEKGNT